MTSEKLDELILSKASPRWQKLAMIITRVSDDESLPSGDSEERLTLIADRIACLMAEGRLAAQGDISNWRHSEVRLPKESHGAGTN